MSLRTKATSLLRCEPVFLGSPITPCLVPSHDVVTHPLPGFALGYPQVLISGAFSHSRHRALQLFDNIPFLFISFTHLHSGECSAMVLEVGGETNEYRDPAL